MLKLMWARLLLLSLLGWSDLTLASEEQATANVTRVSKKGTFLVAVLAGDQIVSKGAKVTMKMGSKTWPGRIRKISKRGRALIKFKKRLPKSIKVGSTIKLWIPKESGESGSEKVRLRKGFAAKAYWDEVAFLATHRRSGWRADLEVGLGKGAGSQTSVGGIEEADIEFLQESDSSTFNGSLGYASRKSNIGSGVLVDRVSRKVIVSADIETAETTTTDKVQNVEEKTILDITPYLLWLDEAKTGDWGFGIGMGFVLRSVKQSSEYVDADTIVRPEDAMSELAGPLIELLVGSNSWSFTLQLAPAISGKEQQGDVEVDRSSSEYGFQFETYGGRIKTRSGITLITDRGEADFYNQDDSGFRISFRLDWDVGNYHFVPFLDYSMLTRELDTAEGTRSELALGSRIAMSGIWAPFVSIGYTSISEEQDGENIASSKIELSSFTLAGGVNL